MATQWHSAFGRRLRARLVLTGGAGVAVLAAGVLAVPAEATETAPVSSATAGCPAGQRI